MLWLAIAVASAGPAELSADGVEATVGQRGITVTADHARWDLKAQRGELAGSVRAVQGDLELRCDSAVVELGGESGGIVRAVATGHVTVSQGHKSATGGRAVLSDGRLELTEEPVLKTEQHRMQGIRIVFVVGEQTIECEGCTVRVGESD